MALLDEWDDFGRYENIERFVTLSIFSYLPKSSL
jgi:hypothetical protein